MIEERVTGFLFDSDEGLGDTAAGLLQSPLTTSVVGNAARIRAEELYDPARCAESVLAAYREIIEG